MTYDSVWTDAQTHRALIHSPFCAPPVRWQESLHDLEDKEEKEHRANGLSIASRATQAAAATSWGLKGAHASATGGTSIGAAAFGSTPLASGSSNTPHSMQSLQSMQAAGTPQSVQSLLSHMGGGTGTPMSALGSNVPTPMAMYFQTAGGLVVTPMMGNGISPMLGNGTPMMLNNSANVMLHNSLWPGAGSTPMNQQQQQQQQQQRPGTGLTPLSTQAFPFTPSNFLTAGTPTGGAATPGMFPGLMFGHASWAAGGGNASIASIAASAGSGSAQSHASHGGQTPHAQTLGVMPGMMLPPAPMVVATPSAAAATGAGVLSAAPHASAGGSQTPASSTTSAALAASGATSAGVSGPLSMPLVMQAATPHATGLSPAWWSNPLTPHNPLSHLLGMGSLLGQTPQAASTPAGGGVGGFLMGQGSGVGGDAPAASAASQNAHQQLPQQDAARQPPASGAPAAADAWSADAAGGAGSSAKPAAQAVSHTCIPTASGAGADAVSMPALQPSQPSSSGGGIFGALMGAQRHQLHQHAPMQSLPGISLPSGATATNRPSTLPGFSPSLFLMSQSPTSGAAQSSDSNSPSWLANPLMTPKDVSNIVSNLASSSSEAADAGVLL